MRNSRNFVFAFFIQLFATVSLCSLTLSQKELVQKLPGFRDDVTKQQAEKILACKGKRLPGRIQFMCLPTDDGFVYTCLSRDGRRVLTDRIKIVQKKGETYFVVPEYTQNTHLTSAQAQTFIRHYLDELQDTPWGRLDERITWAGYWYCDSKKSKENPLKSKGKTIFKECKLCGQLNYDFVSACENCGYTNFTPVYLLPDVQKREERHRKRNKDK
jgi:hypothetical protein